MLSANLVYFSSAPKPDFFLGPLRLHWYGIFTAVAILAAYFLAAKIAPRFHGRPEFVDGVLPWLILAGFIGARLYYVAFAWDFFGQHLNMIWQIWHGGLSIYGAVAGGAAALAVYSKINKINLWSVLALVSTVLPLAQGIGRFGNFFNSEAFGRPTKLPWKMYVAPMSRPPQYLGAQFFHPAFLYEALWDIAVFGILLYLGKRAGSHPAFILASYLVLYPLGRFFIESLRVDSFFIHGLRVDQLVSLGLMLLGAGILYIYRFRS